MTDTPDKNAPGLKMIVWGTPVPQGSKGARVIAGRAHLFDTNATNLKPWRKEIAKACEGRVAEPLDGPVVVRLFFLFAPLVSAPKRRRVYPSTKSSGDLDKLCRAVLDGLVDGKVLADDSRVCGLAAAKDYCDVDEQPRVQIEIRRFVEDGQGGLEWPEGWTSPVVRT